jgi:ATP-dependent DNA helicase DinG
MKAEERLTAAAIGAMQAEIAKAEGNEVLFCGKLDGEGFVGQLYAAARGSVNEVPALFPHMLEGDVVLHNHPSGRLQPSGADLAVASALGNQGIGFYIVNNTVTRLYAVAEPVRVHEAQPLKTDKLAKVLDSDGALSKITPNYEVRPTQIELLRFVAEAFNGNFMALAEGATGVGKSYAYLIPAFAWARQNNERIIISTATIALQEQLLKKDVPAVQKLLKARDVKVILAKGRQNYLCLRRLAETIEEEGLFAAENDELFKIEEWGTATVSGDKSELAFKVKGELWSRVCSESDTCLGIRCKHYNNCFVFKMRKEASSAHIIITNHHLLFADMKLRSEGDSEGLSILPAYKKIIFDEAHHVERSATEFFSDNLTRFGLNRQLMRLLRRRGGQMQGVLPALDAALGKRESRFIERAYKELDAVREAMDKLSSLSLLHVESVFRLTAASDIAIKEGVTEPMRQLAAALTALHETLTQLLNELDDDERSSPLIYEGKSVVSRLAGMAALGNAFTHYDEEPETVFWGEKLKTSQGEAFFRYTATPLDISEKMRQAVYEQHESIVMLSATLAVNGDFTFFKKRVGLYNYGGRHLEEACFLSPFNYKEQALLVYPTDALDPQQNSAGFGRYTEEFLLNLYLTTAGRGLVLFTSYRALREAAEAVSGRLSKAGILVLCQGDEERGKLIRKFEEHGNAVLFGTDSFWEGVDINNKALKSVVICRLPFFPPNAPLAEARAERIERQGGRAFIELQLPEAAIKLKQGFGRLIRRGGDYGAVFIIDSRIRTKFYGKALDEALPEARRLAGPGRDVVEEFYNFLNNRIL